MSHSTRIEPTLTHLRRLTDDVGVIQHALYDIPNRATGYCTDDVTRALIVAIEAHRDKIPGAEGLEATYFSFLHDALRPDGHFHNFMSYERRWLDDIGGEDAAGRAVWALGHGARFARTKTRRRFSLELLERVALAEMMGFSLRSISFTGIGLAHAGAANAHHKLALMDYLTHIGNTLVAAFTRSANPDWRWFEDILTYDNARMPEALLRIGIALENNEYIATALKALEFYESVVLINGIFLPIGSDGWYQRGGTRSTNPQQPLEAAAFIDAMAAAWVATGDTSFREKATIANEWFHGKNSVGTSLVRHGGCADGIDGERLSHNMGAESTIAYLAAAYTMKTFSRSNSVLVAD